MKMLELASAIGGFTRIKEGNVSPTWKGIIQAESCSTPAFIKLLPSNQLLSEVVCNLLGREVGLPIPQGYIVKVPRKILGYVREWPSDKEELVFFGTKDAEHPSFKHYINNSNCEELLKKLLAWPTLNELIVFDEWVANIDRHLGNFLFDGTLEFIPIDHSHALTGGGWSPIALQPETKYTNRIVDELLILNDIQKQKLKNVANDAAADYHSIKITDLYKESFHEEYTDIDDITAVVEFLQQRIEHVVSLIKDHIGEPGLRL